MKKILYVIFAALALTACNGSSNSSNSSNDSICNSSSNEDKTCPKPVEDFITNLYNNYVFGIDDLDSIADNFSPALLDSLRKAYDDEYCDGGPAYAVWLFRTVQNGLDGESIDSIKVDGKDLYTVYLTDGGIPCTCQMNIVMTDGKPVLMHFKTKYDDSSIEL